MIDGRPSGVSNRRRFAAMHASRSTGWAAVDLLLAWHLHTRVGLTGTQTGLTLFAFLAFGGSITFLTGLALSRYRAAGSMVVRIQLLATIATAALLWMQFAVQNLTGAIIAGLAFRTSYAVQDVAQNMLASLLPEDDVDARGYARLRVTLSAVARCIVAGGFAITTADGIVPLLVLIGLVMVATAWTSNGLLFPSSRCVGVHPQSGRRDLPDGLPSLLAMWLVAATLLPTLNRLMIFTPPSVLAPGIGGWLMGGYYLGSMAGPSIGRLANGPMLLLVVGSGLSLVLPPPIFVGEWWRIGGAIVHGIGVSTISVHLWSSTSRLAMDDATKGRTSHGMVFGSVLLTIHVASALGMLVIGPLIEGFETGRQGTSIAAIALTAAGALLIAMLGLAKEERA